MNNLNDFDQLLEKLTGRINSLLEERTLLREEIKKTKELLNAKELERVRATTEQARHIEQLERENSGLQKEKAVLEQKMGDFFNRIKNLVPGEASSHHQERK